MYTLDDPMLALILRFVGRSETIAFCDEGFLREQQEALREHLAGVPGEDRRARALEWVETHAREYRDRWAHRVVDEVFSGERCQDCPLVGQDDAGNCRIHDQWLELFHRYLADEITTGTYVADSLAILARHKKSLKVSPSRAGGALGPR